MTFREKLLATLRAIEPILAIEGVLVLGSEVPNLLEKGAASTLVISQDVDIGIPVQRHAEVKAKLPLIQGLVASQDEPSVWLPQRWDLIEVNFVGIDVTLQHPNDVYVFNDASFPLLVFGTLSYLLPGTFHHVEGLRIPLPSPAGLLLEKLVTERSGVKGDRDLLVVLALLLVIGDHDVRELRERFHLLVPETREVVRSNLTLLSLLDPVVGMPDPRLHRETVAHLLALVEETSR